MPLSRRAAGFVIGREKHCALVLRDPAVTRRHLALECDGRRWVVTDYGSTHGVLVQGQRVDRHALTSGERIIVGMSHFQFIQGDLDAQCEEIRAYLASTEPRSGLPSRRRLLDEATRTSGGLCVLVAALADDGFQSSWWVEGAVREVSRQAAALPGFRSAARLGDRIVAALLSGADVQAAGRAARTLGEKLCGTRFEVQGETHAIDLVVRSVVARDAAELEELV